MKPSCPPCALILLRTLQYSIGIRMRRMTHFGHTHVSHTCLFLHICPLLCPRQYDGIRYLQYCRVPSSTPPRTLYRGSSTRISWSEMARTVLCICAGGPGLDPLETTKHPSAFCCVVCCEVCVKLTATQSQPLSSNGLSGACESSQDTVSPMLRDCVYKQSDAEFKYKVIQNIHCNQMLQRGRQFPKPPT